METDRDPIFAGKQSEQGDVHSPSRVESQASGRVHPDRVSGASLGTILTSCVLAFLMGGAGAWTYLNYLDPMLAKQRAQKSQPDSQKSELVGADSAARLNDLGSKLDELQSRVDRVPKAISEQDLQPLNQKLAVVDDLSRKVDALVARVSSLPGKVDQDSRKITTLAADLVGMRNEVSTLRNDVHSTISRADKALSREEKPSEKGEKPGALTSSEPPREISVPVSSLLRPGVEFFQKQNYAEASEVFAGLTRTRPDDARVWYYAALSRGLATRDWKGETERLVTQGVDREKAGKPDRPQIDAAVADLTAETGKDWLAFYRQRAH